MRAKSVTHSQAEPVMHWNRLPEAPFCSQRAFRAEPVTQFRAEPVTIATDLFFVTR